ncbi:MAG: hypothetical protein LQ343_003813 [Gyalolechia ehrenbergii]|nr:MAG: hypothetical protein LQ343_003813 [Gyalolechia ehrenbergii]
MEDLILDNVRDWFGKLVSAEIHDTAEPANREWSENLKAWQNGRRTGGEDHGTMKECNAAISMKNLLRPKTQIPVEAPKQWASTMTATLFHLLHRPSTLVRLYEEFDTTFSSVEQIGHGTLHAIYASVKKTCEAQEWDGVDLLIIGGDFQAVRNSYDLNAMSVPAKYRAIGDFHEYYSGSRVAPYLTLFVGGNHEASNHLWELYYGGWVAPHIYYMGTANVVNFGSLRIAGLSGIWSGPDYKKPHYERLPYGPSELRSIYHVRELDVRKLLQIRSQVDVGMSHDWPWKVEWKGDWKQLFRFKPHFQSDAKSGRLGSPAGKYVMDRLRPKWWFAAHLHCKFSAVMNHDIETDSYPRETPSQGKDSFYDTNGVANTDRIDLDIDADRPSKEDLPNASANVQNIDEIDLDMNDDATAVSNHILIGDSTGPDTQVVSAEPDGVPSDLRNQLPAAFSRPPPASTPSVSHPEAITNKTTHFLSLDKCLPRRKFLQLLDIEPIAKSSDSIDPKRPGLTYDKEWLAITRAFRSINPLTSPIPLDRGEAYYRPLIEAEEVWVEENLVKTDKMKIPEIFEITAPVYDPKVGLRPKEYPKEYTNPQTVAFCEMLGMENFFAASEQEREARRATAPPISNDGNGGRGHRGRGRGFGGRGGGGGGGGRGPGRGRGYR